MLESNKLRSGKPNTIYLTQKRDVSLYKKSIRSAEASHKNNNVISSKTYKLTYDTKEKKFKLDNEEVSIKYIPKGKMTKNLVSRILEGTDLVSVDFSSETEYFTPCNVYLDNDNGKNVIIFNQDDPALKQMFSAVKKIADNNKIATNQYFGLKLKDDVTLNGKYIQPNTTINNQNLDELIKNIIDNPTQYNNRTITNASELKMSTEGFEYRIETIKPVLDSDGKVDDIHHSTSLKMKLVQTQRVVVSCEASNSGITDVKVVFEPDNFNMTYPKIIYTKDNNQCEISMKNEPTLFAKTLQDLFDNDKALNVEVGGVSYCVDNGKITLNSKVVTDDEFKQAVKEVEQERSQQSSSVLLNFPAASANTSSRLSLAVTTSSAEGQSNNSERSHSQNNNADNKTPSLRKRQNSFTLQQ